MTPTEYAYTASGRYEYINTQFIIMMAEHIKEIGKLTPKDLHRLQQLSKMDANISKINTMLIQATSLTLDELKQVYQNSSTLAYNDTIKRFIGNGEISLPEHTIKALERYYLALFATSGSDIVNIVKSTSILPVYKNLVETAIRTVYEGTEDYQSAVRTILKDSAMKGMRVEYSSGITRRLDSALRMNILDGIRQINNNVNEVIGKQVNADGVLISAHANCAEDHLDIQGKMFYIEEFKKLNASLNRPISTMNCRHTISPIMMNTANPYSAEYLKKLRADSIKKYQIGNKEVTRYEATQLMRKIETQMRYQKDYVIAGRHSGDTVLVQKSKARLKQLKSTYLNICDITGLTSQLDRASVPGYKN